MKKLNSSQQTILELFIAGDYLQSSEVFELLESGINKMALVSVKRNLSEMVHLGALRVEGSGRSTRYQITTPGRLFFETDPAKYIQIEPDQRSGLSGYNFDLFQNIPNGIFNYQELIELERATKKYKERSAKASKGIKEKELQRLVIELSWKSSKIEGNTYTLLDTEKLILEAKQASGHDKKEAIMILNHKDAFNEIYKNAANYKNLTAKNLEKIHSILVKGLNVNHGFRKSLVGITGSKYKPLDNVYQIGEAVEELSALITKTKDPYSKAMLAILGISYIQPFEDGNKRTARLMANALLLSHKCAPLSYRSVNEQEYRNSLLVFYEINSLVSFKKIFREQYLFSAENYAL